MVDAKGAGCDVLELAIYPPKGSEFGGLESNDDFFNGRSGELCNLSMTSEDADALLVDRFAVSRWGDGGARETIASSTESAFDNRLSMAVGGLEAEISIISLLLVLFS